MPPFPLEARGIGSIAADFADITLTVGGSAAESRVAEASWASAPDFSNLTKMNPRPSATTSTIAMPRRRAPVPAFTRRTTTSSAAALSVGSP